MYRMIFISHELKSIYIHIPKCGGTYIGNILSNFYNFQSFGINRFNQTEYYNGDDNMTNLLNDLIIEGSLKFCMNPRFYIFLGMDYHKWNSYFIFTFIRNPYKRLISSYFNYCRDNNSSITINEFINNKDSLNPIYYYHSFTSQYKSLLNLNNEINFNFIGNIDLLDVHLNNVLKCIGVNELTHLKYDNTHLKNESLIKENYYQTYYNDEIYRITNFLFQKDIYFFTFAQLNNTLCDGLYYERLQLPITN